MSNLESLKHFTDWSKALEISQPNMIEVGKAIERITAERKILLEIVQSFIEADVYRWKNSVDNKIKIKLAYHRAKELLEAIENNQELDEI